ncbi:CinA family protein [Olivibacter sp. SDN3]|uniref:CinA family protein n=1 Tax=Olivibacter sp. SDN3 TaxID=2764720 RepID=UPI0016517D39|nr:CinA family protein [Olivibacter sp. SDN3]QNL48405.1 CinA family protein [Olivibacter sp. SDN3]
MSLELIVECSKLIADKGLTIAFAESATAGRACSLFSFTPYAGKVLKGGVVCYDASVKIGLLGIPAALIRRYTPESAEVTETMANALKKMMNADIYVAITGLTASGGSESPVKPVGTMFIHLLLENLTLSVSSVFSGTSEEIVDQTICKIASLLRDVLRK